MKKQEQIQAKLIKPIEVGDMVRMDIDYTKDVTEKVKVGRKNEIVNKTIEQKFVQDGRVVLIEDDKVHLEIGSVSIPNGLDKIITTYYPAGSVKVCIVDKKYISQTTYECGANPFGREKRRISFYNQDVSSLLMKAGYGRRSNDFMVQESNEGWNRINFNPFVIDADGNRQYYQRGLVWTLEQKQLLIESIYNDIEIGKFLFRYNSWERMEKEREESGIGHSYDCVDGKQRFHAILEFLQGKFPDSHGNFWSDLSDNAHRRFLNYGNLSYGELPESATDEDVIDNFLTLNHTGTPMSKEHIDFIRSINIK